MKSYFFRQHPADGFEALLGEDWTKALTTLDGSDAKHAREVLCPKDYEYELDSDFEDEDETSSEPCNSGGEGDLTFPERESSISAPSAALTSGRWTGQELEGGTEKSTSSSSSFVLEGGQRYVFMCL